MGFDKALARFGQTSLLERLVATADASAASSTIVVGGDPLLAASAGVAHVSDSFPGEGPLGGVVTALEHTESDVAVVVSCDLPFLQPRSIDEMAAGLHDADLAVAAAGGIDQWHCTAWRRDPGLQMAQGLFDNGSRAIRDAANELHVVRVDSIAEDQLRDVDTPEQLSAAGGTPPPGHDVSCVTEH